MKEGSGTGRALQRVSAVPHPFSGNRVDYEVPYGLTIWEIIKIVQPDPVLREHGVVFIGDQIVPKELWHRVKPKPKAFVSIRLLPSGAGGFRIAAMIGIAVLAIGIAVFMPYALPGLGIMVGPAMGALIGGVAAAGFAFGATMLLNRLIPPPIPEISKGYGNDNPSYAISGSRNRANPWGKVVFLLGRFRITPTYAAQPYREVVGGQIYWRALFAIAHGPIACDEIRVGSTLIENFQGVETEFRRGYWTLNNKGNWSASTGTFPSEPSFGDTWTVNIAGTISGTDFAVGDTITFNGIDVRTSPTAWDLNQGKPLGLFPSDVFEDSLASEVKFNHPVVRASKANADELTVELVFERGLVHIQNNPPGKRSDSTTYIKVEQSPIDQDNWVTIFNGSVTDRRTTPVYWGRTWKPSEFGGSNVNKDYDVRVSRLDPDMDEERNFGNFSWYALRTITLQNPTPISAMAMLAVRIKASGQLSGSLDELNMIGTSICRDWDDVSRSWKWRQTSQPAALFRNVLQHPSRSIPLADGRIDLNRLSYWDSITRQKSREFNGVIEAKTSVYDALIKICRIGRATPTMRDLMISVVIDEPKTVPVRLFSPTNSWDYSGKMVHQKIPHAYRIGFVNAAKEWTADERLVYDDGYDATNATLIDRVEWPGVISSDQAWKEGRYHLAQQRLGLETHKVTVDFEHLACERGDLVALQHDVIAVGLGSARIKDVVIEDNNVAAVTLDNGINMEDGREYGFRARRVVGGAMRTDLYKIATQVGMHYTVYFASPLMIGSAPVVGDLIAFGEYDRETLRVLLRDIEPRQDLTATLTFVPEAPGVHVAELGPIPPYDPVITRPHSLLSPVILNIQSDAKVMLVTASRSLITRVVFTVVASTIADTSIFVSYRPTGVDGQWQIASVQEETPTTVAIVGFDSGGVYDFRLQRTHRQYLASPATSVNAYHVIGGAGLPDGLRNLTLSISSGQALLRWDLPSDIDVQYGGWIIFRHTPLMDGASWPNTTSIGRVVNGDQTHVWLPLKGGTYMARVYDRDGLESLETASISTKQASVLDFAPVADMVEDPDFSGVKVNCELFIGENADIIDDFDDVPSVDAAGITGLSGLGLSATGDFDSVQDIDSLINWDLISKSVVSAGTYSFAGGLDFLTIRKVRLTSHILSDAVNLYADIDGDDFIDSQDDFDGTEGAPVDATVWVQITDDNPNLSPKWSKYIRIDSAEIEARAIGNAICILQTESPQNNILVRELRLFADMVMRPGEAPDARASGFSVAIGKMASTPLLLAVSAGSSVTAWHSTSVGMSVMTAAGTSSVSGETILPTASSSGSAVSSVIGVSLRGGTGISLGASVASYTSISGGITFRGVGTFRSANNASVAPPFAEVPQAGDLLLCYSMARMGTGTLATPTGYSVAYAGVGSHRHDYLFYKIAVGGETNPVIVPSGGAPTETVIAQCASFRGTHPTSVLDVVGTGVEWPIQQNCGPIPGITPTANNSMVVVVAAKQAVWTAVSVLGGDALTWNQIGSATDATWGPVSIVWDYAIWSSTPPTLTSKTFVVTGGNTSMGGGCMISFKRA